MSLANLRGAVKLKLDLEMKILLISEALKVFFSQSYAQKQKLGPKNFLHSPVRLQD